MPRYRFTAVDADGNPHDGNIDAATPVDARKKLASNGLTVQSVEQVETGGTEPVASGPRRAAPPSASDSHAELPRRSPLAPREPTGKKSSPLPLICSLLALLVSLGTAAYTLTRGSRETRDTGADHLAKYDFSTPERAYKSSLQMIASGDVMARLQREMRFHQAAAKERLDTFDVDRVRTFDEKKVLFLKYKRNGKPRQVVRWFEKDLDTGMWRRSYEMDFGMRANNLPGELAQEIANWVTPLELEDHDGPDVD